MHVKRRLDHLPGLVALLFLLAGFKASAAHAQPYPELDHVPSPPGTTFILADEQFVSGTLQSQQAVERFLKQQESFLLDVPLEPVIGREMPAPAALVLLGEAYSVSPALLLALAENEHGILTGQEPSIAEEALADWLRWTAVILSRWFYDHYHGAGLDVLTPLSGSTFRPDAGNAATYALRLYYFANVYTEGDPAESVSAWEQMLVSTYETYFGSAHAGRLKARHPSAGEIAARPTLKLPWPGGETWYFTGGPHNFDGSNRRPLSGIDFQPAGYPGCNPQVARRHWVTAGAAGRTVNDQSHWLKVDHDHDGNASTGWQTVYGHLANRIEGNVDVQQGQRLGHPSCHGGYASGVHLHFGVKFENVWQPIDSVTLSGWAIENGLDAYHGTMTKPGKAERQSCFHPDRPTIDCAHSALISDNDPAAGDLYWRIH